LGSTQGADISIPAGTVRESDTATIAGTNASSAEGTVDFALYKNSSCTGTPVFAGASEASAGVASIADDSSSGLNVGKYYWEAVYAATQRTSRARARVAPRCSPPAAIGGSGTTTGSTVTLTISCAAACTVTVTLEVPSGSAADVASAARKKARKPVKLGTVKLRFKKGGKHKLVLKLNGKGKRLLRKDNDKLKATLLLSTKTAHGTFASKGTLKIRKAKHT
jgi:hypothetical protein